MKTVKKAAKKSAKKRPANIKAKKSVKSRATSAAKRRPAPTRGTRGGTVTLTHEASPPPYGRLLAVATPAATYEVNTTRPAELFEVNSTGGEISLGNMMPCNCPVGSPASARCYERNLSSNPSGKHFRAKVWFVHHQQHSGDAYP